MHQEENNEKDDSSQDPKIEVEEKTIEEKFQETEEKLLRSLAEIENQRRRFEKK